MRKLMILALAVLIGLSHTASIAERDEAVIVGMLQFDVPIGEEDRPVADGYLTVRGIVKQGEAGVPADSGSGGEPDEADSVSGARHEESQNKEEGALLASSSL